MIQYIFPVPIYTTNVTDSFIEENKQLENFDVIKGSTGNFGDRSSNSYVLDDFRLGRLSRWILQHIEQYSSQELYKDLDVKHYVFLQSWISVKQPQQRHNPHHHPNSVISGVYYWEDTQQPLVFLSSRHVEFGPTQSEKDQHILNVSSGMLVLFPSYLTHMVPTNTTNVPRKSLAFNSIPTTGLGHEGQLTELNLVRLKYKLIK